MKKHPIRTLIIVVVLAIVCWGAMFAIDYSRCSKLEKPIFVMPSDDVDFSDSGTYNGIFYSVIVESHNYTDYEKGNNSVVVVDSVEMYLFGNFIVGSVS